MKQLDEFDLSVGIGVFHIPQVAALAERCMQLMQHHAANAGEAKKLLAENRLLQSQLDEMLSSRLRIRLHTAA